MSEVPISRFNWVDVLAIILLFRMGYVGFRLGLSAEIVKVMGVVGGFFLSFRYYQTLGGTFPGQSFLRVEWTEALMMVSLFLVAYMVISRGLRLLDRLVQLTFQTQFNQIGGCVLGVIRGVLVTSVILVVCRQLPSPYLNESIEVHSFMGNTLSRVAPAMYDSVFPFMTHFLKSLRVPSS